MLYVLELFTQDSKCYCNSCSTRVLLRGKCHSLEKHQEQHMWHTVAHCMQTAGEAECFPRPAGIQGKSALSKYGTKITPINSEAQGTLWRQSRRKGIGGEGGAGRMRPQEAWESKEGGKVQQGCTHLGGCQSSKELLADGVSSHDQPDHTCKAVQVL